MTSRAWMILGLTGLWFWACQYWYTCPIKEVGYSCKQEVEKPVAKSKDGPLVFAWEDATPITNDDFYILKNEILEGMTDDNVLEIYGPYTKSEDNSSTFDNLGLARANMIKEMFIDDIPRDRIYIFGSKITEKKKMRRGTWKGASFSWVDKKGNNEDADNALAAEIDEYESGSDDKLTTKIAPPTFENKETGQVIEMDDRALIYFPADSVEKSESERIDEYITALASRLQYSDEKVMLTGHTDSRGTYPANKALGLRRAKMIRDLLKQEGVDPNKIITKSEGERKPIATNMNKLGRMQNRRVVVEIIK